MWCWVYVQVDFGFMPKIKESTKPFLHGSWHKLQYHWDSHEIIAQSSTVQECDSLLELEEGCHSSNLRGPRQSSYTDRPRINQRKACERSRG